MRRRGFTLLEVLAAVAVLALAYSVLAGTAMQGLANEGEAHRRLRASLLADLQLSEIEAALAAGTPPAPVPETELDDYTLSVEVLPYDLADFATAAQQQVAETRAAPRPPTGGAADAAAAGPPLQLLSAAPGAPPPLFEVIVHVRWVEGAFEREVTRTTFTADPIAVQQAVATLPGAGGEDAGGKESAAPDAEPQPGEQAAPPSEEPDDFEGGE